MFTELAGEHRHDVLALGAMPEMLPLFGIEVEIAVLRQEVQA